MSYNNYTPQKFYFDFDSSTISLPVEMVTDVEFTYMSTTGSTSVANTLSGPYASFQEFLDAWNAAQSIYVFKELVGTEKKRAAKGVVCVEVIMNEYQPEFTWENSLVLAFAAGETADPELKTLYPVNTGQDQATQLLADIKEQNTTIIAQNATMITHLASIDAKTL